MSGALVIAALLAQAVAAQTPELGEERVLVRTSAGDLVLELFDSRAPLPAAYFRELVKAGFYDNLNFNHVEPGVWIESPEVANRPEPLLTRAQLALLRPIPQGDPEITHQRGTVTFVDRASRGAAIAIVLNDSPFLDGSAVPFGRVALGFDVLDEIAAVPLSAHKQPLIYVGIEKVELVSATEGEARRISRRALYSAIDAHSEKAMRTEVIAIVAAILFGTFAMSLFAARLPKRAFQAARVMVLLVGGLGLLGVLLPLGPRTPIWGALLLFGLVALFKLMGRFESARVVEQAPPKQ
jgi:cyclophilin family peptidyl-prolyl cis-trans isomerase